MVSLLRSSGGLASPGNTAKYFISVVAFSNSTRACRTSSGLVRKSSIAPAKTFAADTIPLWAIVLVGVTPACQLCAVIPGTVAGKFKAALGTTHVTSPLSLHHPACPRRPQRVGLVLRPTPPTPTAARN